VYRPRVNGRPRVNVNCNNLTLHVEQEYCILFIISLFCEYIHLEYIRIDVIYRVNQAEYVLHILVVAPQEYVNIYSTRSNLTLDVLAAGLEAQRQPLGSREPGGVSSAWSAVKPPPVLERVEGAERELASAASSLVRLASCSFTSFSRRPTCRNRKPVV